MIGISNRSRMEEKMKRKVILLALALLFVFSSVISSSATDNMDVYNEYGSTEIQEVIVDALFDGKCQVLDSEGEDITDSILRSLSNQSRVNNPSDIIKKVIDLGGVHFSAHIVKGSDPETIYMQYYVGDYHEYTGNTGAINNKTWGITVWASGSYELYPTDSTPILHNFTNPGFSYQGLYVGAMYNLTSVTIYPSYPVQYSNGGTVANFNAYVTHYIQYLIPGSPVTYGPFSSTYTFTVSAP